MAAEAGVKLLEKPSIKELKSLDASENFQTFDVATKSTHYMTIFKRAALALLLLAGPLAAQAQSGGASTQLGGGCWQCIDSLSAVRLDTAYCGKEYGLVGDGIRANLIGGAVAYEYRFDQNNTPVAVISRTTGLPFASLYSGSANCHYAGSIQVMMK